MSGITEDMTRLANDNPFEGSSSPAGVLRLTCREAAKQALIRARNDISMSVPDTAVDESDYGRGELEGERTCWHIINDLILELSDAPRRG